MSWGSAPHCSVVFGNRFRCGTPPMERAEFDRELERAARTRPDIELIDADRLRHGD